MTFVRSMLEAAFELFFAMLFSYFYQEGL